MRGSFIFLLVIGLLLLSVSAEGANWKYIATTDEGNTSIYIDTESISHISKTAVRLWSKALFKETEPFDSKRIVERLTYAEFDCVERKQCILQFDVKYLDGSSEVITVPEKEIGCYDIYPDTISSLIFDYICKKGE
jgi:hypothetical protein